MAKRLAIVIPAYKGQFLERTLQSIASQTNRDFSVYIGDDCSPDDIEAICRPFRSTLDLRYTRFTDNLGQSNLVAHWHRCIALCSEPWVWLFGDDDVMSDNCVASFYDFLDARIDPPDLLRFRVDEIDQHGAVVKTPRTYPSPLSASSFCKLRLTGKMASYVPEYIFSRAALDSVGGFEEFPLAWCSDDATWIKLAGASGIHAIPFGTVSWRRSGANITSHRPELKEQKFRAAVQFLAWLDTQTPRARRGPEQADLDAIAFRWLLKQSRYLGVQFFPRNWKFALERLPHLFAGHLTVSLLRMMMSDARSVWKQARGR